MVLTKAQSYILKIYFGYAYSLGRNLTDEEIITKKEKLKEICLKDFIYSIHLMEQHADEYHGSDFQSKKIYFLAVFGYEIAKIVASWCPVFLFPLCRLFLAPPLNDRDFYNWSVINSPVLQILMHQIKYLEDLPEDFDPVQYIFNQKNN